MRCEQDFYTRHLLRRGPKVLLATRHRVAHQVAHQVRSTAHPVCNMLTQYAIYWIVLCMVSNIWITLHVSCGAYDYTCGYRRHIVKPYLTLYSLQVLEAIGAQMGEGQAARLRTGLPVLWSQISSAYLASRKGRAMETELQASENYY